MKPSAILFCLLCLTLASQPRSQMTAEQAFELGKSFAQSGHGASAIQNAITTGDPSEKVPNYGTTHAHSGLFMGGDGDLFTPGANRVGECKTTLYSDPRKQVECDAINDVAGYKTTRPKMEIKPTDSIITKARHTSKNAIEVLKGFGLDIKQEQKKQCTEKTVETPAQYKYETCTVLRQASGAQCVMGRKIEIDADSNFQCDKTLNAYETHKCQRWIDLTQVCDVKTPLQTETIVESYWWCGDSCYFPREWEGIGAFKRAASRAGNVVGPTIYEYICWGDSDGGGCYSKYTVNTSGGAPITLKLDSYTFGTGHVLTYDDMNGVCLGGICTWKTSKKPMVYFISSATGECTDKVWVPPHHDGRYPGHWACKDTGIVLTCPSGYTLEITPDGNRTCVGNCVWNVTHNSNCGLLGSGTP